MDNLRIRFSDETDAKSNLEVKKRGDILPGDKADPCQILKCPWCGEEILPQNYNVDLSNKRMHIHCPKKDCHFHEQEAE